MTKKIFLILAVAGMSCSLHMKAAVPPVTKDTVQLESYTDVEQMLRPLEPTYRKGVFVTSPWNETGLSVFKVVQVRSLANRLAVLTFLIGYDQRFPHRSASGSLRRSEQESVMEVGSSKIADWPQMTTITFMLT